MAAPLVKAVFQTNLNICSHLKRCISTTSACYKIFADRVNIRAGKIKPSKGKAVITLTYEEYIKSHEIGVKKSWNSWNTSNLHEISEQAPMVAFEDMFIRKFMYGTWHGLFASEVIIKRRQNVIIIAGLVLQRGAERIYFLLGYTEELLSHFLKRPVRMEIQTVDDRNDVVFKLI